MEVYEERSWISDDRRIPKRPRDDRERILPSRLIAEYCPHETLTIASILVSYHEADTAEPPSSPILYDDSAVKWVASHSKMLYRHYPDRWILVGDKRVIASADDPNELFLTAEAQGIEAPFITRVVQPTKRKTMIYAK